MRQELVKDHPVALLRQEGTTNPEIEEILENNNFSSQDLEINGKDSCQLDQILDEPVDSEEEVYSLNNDFYIASTEAGPGNPEMGWEDGRKGHETRNMTVWRDHSILPATEGLNSFPHPPGKVLQEVTARQIQEGGMVVYGSMESISDHFHFIASDLENEGESDLGSVNSYFLYNVENGRPELTEYNIRDNIGEYLGEHILPHTR